MRFKSMGIALPLLSSFLVHVIRPSWHTTCVCHLVESSELVSYRKGLDLAALNHVTSVSRLSIHHTSPTLPQSYNWRFGEGMLT